MKKNQFINQRIAIASHPTMPEAINESVKVAQYLRDNGVEPVITASLYDNDLRQKITYGEFDLLIVLGGDGTMLRAGHLCGPISLPILGINMGRIGFLIEVKRDQWKRKLKLLLQGEYRLEERMMLKAEHWRENLCLGDWQVLNEVVVCRGRYVRPIQLHASVDGYRLASYVADGLIAATPTGSTAYALAVGGPIMPPDLRNILVIPVAPHLSPDRAIILSQGANVSIKVNTTHEAVFSVDGHTPVVMLDGDEVRVKASDHLVKFVRFQDRGYFYRNINRYMEQNPITGDIDDNRRNRI